MVRPGDGEPHQVDHRSDPGRAGVVIPEQAVVGGQEHQVVTGIDRYPVHMRAG